MASLNDIRSTFLDYFEKQRARDRRQLAAVPRNDPTLMFTNSGMVQFKNLFTGVEHRDYTRAATSQKCVRAGGKHNDLDNVGYTARHHTFFEMLGNFSFGDYFKERRSPCLGAADEGFRHRQVEAAGHRLPHRRRGGRDLEKGRGPAGRKDHPHPHHRQFLADGPTGPCGPCTEIFYDHGDHIWGGPPGSPDEDGDRFIEIWNLVFMQFEQFEDGSMPGPRHAVDRHRHGAGADRRAPAGQARQLRHRPDARLIEASAMRPIGRSGRAEERASPGDRGPSALDLLPDRGRGDAVERGARLCAAPDHAARDAACASARRAGPADVPAGARAGAQMGQAYPELGRAQALITETLKLEEDPLQAPRSTGAEASGR
jgi:alanyl-tRNA synthetase